MLYMTGAYAWIECFTIYSNVTSIIGTLNLEFLHQHYK